MMGGSQSLVSAYARVLMTSDLLYLPSLSDLQKSLRSSVTPSETWFPS